MQQLRLTFDSNLSRELMPSIVKIVRERQEKTLPDVLVRDYQVSLIRDGKAVWEKEITNNGQRLNIHELNGILCDTIRITVTATYGNPSARIFEIRAY